MEPINVKLVLDNLNQQYANTDLPRRPLSRSERKLLQVLQSKSVRWRNCQAFFNVCLTVVVKEFTTSNYLDFEEFDSLEFEYSRRNTSACPAIRFFWLQERQSYAKNRE